jgi:hypothetical protein
MESDNRQSEITKPRSWMGWLKGIGWGVLLLAVFAAIGLLWNREKRASKLQTTLAELDRSDPGWRLEDIEAAREDVPEEKNSANVVVAAARLLPKPWPPKDLSEEHFRLLPPPELLNDEDFALLSRELARVRPVLEMAAPLADMPHGRHRLHYERNPIQTLLTDQQESRSLISLLVYEAMRQNQTGESRKALTTCRATLNAARSLGDEPIFISQLIRIAGVVLACQAIERTLAQGEPPPEDLSALQKLLEDEDAFPGLLLAMRGERAALNQVFEGVERSEISLDELEGSPSGSPSDWLKSTVTSLWCMETREDHTLFLSLMNRRIKEVQAPMHEQAALEQGFEEEVRRQLFAGPGMARITRLLLPAMSKISAAFRRKHAYLRCTIAALAAERYRRDRKAWPKSIDNLCSKYLVSVPLDPFDGRPLRYLRLKDGVMIYTVGHDAIDNGGRLDPAHPNESGVDIGIRLWDAAKRRHPPRTKPPALDPK